MVEPREIMIEYLHPNPWQPREEIDSSELKTLSRSIQDYGFSGYLEARKDPLNPEHLQLVFGHRRAQAAQLAGLKTLPVVIRDYTDQQMAELGMLENVTQRPLSYYEEGLAFRKLIQEFGYTTRQLADNFGRSLGYVTNRLAVTDLPEDSPLLEAARSGEVDMTVIQTLRMMLKERPQKEVNELLMRVKAEELTGDDVRAIRSSHRRSMPEDIGMRESEIITFVDHRAEQEAQASELKAKQLARQQWFKDHGHEYVPQFDLRQGTEVIKGPEQPTETTTHRMRTIIGEPEWQPVTPAPAPLGKAAQDAIFQIKSWLPDLKKNLRRADFSEVTPKAREEWIEASTEVINLLTRTLPMEEQIECCVQILDEKIASMPLNETDHEEMLQLRQRFTDIMKHYVPVVTMLAVAGGDKLIRRTLTIILPLVLGVYVHLD